MSDDYEYDAYDADNTIDPNYLSLCEKYDHMIKLALFVKEQVHSGSRAYELASLVTELHRVGWAADGVPIIGPQEARPRHTCRIHP